MACIGGEALNVAALAFGIDRIKCEGRFTGAGEAGDDGQRIPWDGDINIFEVMGAGTADANGVVLSKSHVLAHRKMRARIQKPHTEGCGGLLLIRCMFRIV